MVGTDPRRGAQGLKSGLVLGLCWDCKWAQSACVLGLGCDLVVKGDCPQKASSVCTQNCKVTGALCTQPKAAAICMGYSRH